MKYGFILLTGNMTSTFWILPNRMMSNNSMKLSESDVFDKIIFFKFHWAVATHTHKNKTKKQVQITIFQHFRLLNLFVCYHKCSPPCWNLFCLGQKRVDSRDASKRMLLLHDHSKGSFSSSLVEVVSLLSNMLSIQTAVPPLLFWIQG